VKTTVTAVLADEIFEHDTLLEKSIWPPVYHFHARRSNDRVLIQRHAPTARPTNNSARLPPTKIHLTSVNRGMIRVAEHRQRGG
jgi:hypothetical protein